MTLVKDKLNLLKYNQWSATEYSNDFNGFAQLGAVSSSEEHTTIGEKSLKLISYPYLLQSS